MRSKFTLMLASFLLLCINFSFGQEKTISGNVTDQNGLPLPGVSVVVVGTTSGTQTDFDGNYTVSANEGQVLRYSYLGQKTVNRTVGASNTINVQMEEDAEALEEVVVVGYGNQEEKKIIQNVGIVKQEAIENLQVISADQLLQGQTAGTQIVNASGVLGSAAVIRVRGVNSINAGSQPLIVIDGVPITDTESSLNQGGNTGINPLSFVNPNDIESLTVLKDAGATSIYGSRGANGVILITTKKGRRGEKTTVTLDVNTQFSNSTDVPDILTADEFRQFKSEVASIQNGSTVTPEDLGLGSIGDPGEDYLDGVQRTGISQNYNLGVRGGTEKTSFFIGLDYQDQQGFIVANDLERLGARINIDTDATDWLKVGMNLGVTNQRLNRIGVENNTFAPFTTAFLQNPTVRAFDDEGNFVPSGSFIPNIFAIIDLDTRELKSFRLIGNAFTEVSVFNDKFKWRSEFGVDRLQTEEFTRSVEFNNPGGTAQQIFQTEERWLTNQTFTYSDVFNDKHSLNVLMGLNYEETLRTRLNVSGNGFLSDDLRNLGSALNVQVLNGDRFPTRLFGLFSRVTYDYDGKYLVEGSVRRDGSSRFGANNRFGYFWSAAAGWVISEESFIKDVSWIDYLTLRASIGTVGNDRLGTFPSLATFNAGPIGDFNGQSGIIPGQAANPDLKWEESQTLDLGIKSTFLNGRINFNASYFKKNTTDLLLNQRVPPQTGFFSVSRNIGELQNTGLEFELNTIPVSTENFEWRLGFNLTTIDNEIIALNEDAETDADGRRIIDNGAQRAIEGESLNNFFLIRYVGVNPQTGDAEWLDVDGNITTSPGSADRVVTGSALPDFSGGITTSIRYKNFDFSALANYSYGNEILIDGLRFFDGNDAIGGIVNIRRQNLNFWRQPGDNAFLPSPTSSTFNTFNQRSDLQQLDGSYLRLKNVTIGYNFPQETLERIGLLQGLRFYATATNLWTLKGDDLDGIDPEVTDDIDPRFQGESFFTAPQSISFIVGARLTF
nr:TonB-dependent receptor [uncultured Allomuricauda sp.]